MSGKLNRQVLNNVISCKRQVEYYDEFKQAHSGVRLKNSRVCLLRTGDINLFQFVLAKGLRKYLCYLPISDGALDAMVALRSELRSKEEGSRHVS